MKHKFVYPRIQQKKMTTTATISTINIEPQPTVSIELTEKEKFANRFQSKSSKKTNQSNNKKSSSTGPTVRPLRADDIKEHRLWSILSLIFCFFLIAPCFAFYHSRRIRMMKQNEELTRAQLWSARVGNTLIISTIIGIILWVAIIFVLAVLFVMGAVY